MAENQCYLKQFVPYERELFYYLWFLQCYYLSLSRVNGSYSTSSRRDPKLFWFVPCAGELFLIFASLFLAISGLSPVRGSYSGINRDILDEF